MSEPNGQSLLRIPWEDRTAEICLIAVREDGRNLRWVPHTRRTKEILHAAVSQWGWSLLFIPYKWRTPEICLAAVEQDGRVLGLVPSARRSKKIQRAALARDAHALAWTRS